MNILVPSTDFSIIGLETRENGVSIKTIESDNDLAAMNKNLLFSALLNKAYNIYFTDLNNVIHHINYETAQNWQHSSIHEPLGRSIEKFANSRTFSFIYHNNQHVIKQKELFIFDETVYSEQAKIIRESLTFKIPWHDNFYNIIGIFGFSIVVNKHNLSQGLNFLLENGLLSLSMKNKLIAHSLIQETYFSPQQIRCLKLLTMGMTTKQIARSLNLSPRTIEHYLENAKNKIKVSTKQELTAFCINYFYTPK